MTSPIKNKNQYLWLLYSIFCIKIHISWLFLYWKFHINNPPFFGKFHTPVAHYEQYGMYQILIVAKPISRCLDPDPVIHYLKKCIDQIMSFLKKKQTNKQTNKNKTKNKKKKKQATD